MTVTFKGQECQLLGNPPIVGDPMPDFTVLAKDGKKISLQDLPNAVTLLSIVPDINTPVCSIQTQKFNQKMDQFPQVNFLTISTNTISDQQKWCAAKGVKQMQLVSDQDHVFGKASGLLIPDKGILARSVWIIKAGKIVYREIVKEITDEPNYEQALAALKKLN